MIRFEFRKTLLAVTSAVAMGLASVACTGTASAADKKDWDDLKQRARGQTVYFHAWGGAENINDYISWAGTRVKDLYGITLKQVKVTDTGEVVNQVLAERQAGKTDNGSVDLVWINGENFARMKRNHLLFGPFTDRLPSMDLVDSDANPATVFDFTIPTEGFESPWGTAQLVFMYDEALLAEPPAGAKDLQRWILANPGRFTYPSPPDFLGSTFLKQLMMELATDRGLFMKPVPEGMNDAALMQATAPVWQWLDVVQDSLWRSGRSYPVNETAMLQLMGDGELDIAFAFSPFRASSAISDGILPASVRSYIHKDGTIANAHFVAIPFNSGVKPAAMVVAEFLLSPEAQINKQDPRVWGDPSVLAMGRLNDEEQEAFRSLPLGAATLTPDQLLPALPEPHPDWMEVLERLWKAKYL